MMNKDIYYYYYYYYSYSYSYSYSYYYYYYYYYYPIGTSSRSKYIVYTRMRKSVNTQVECSISNMEHSLLIFTTTGGMRKECLNYHSRLAELIAIKKGEDYIKTISWIRARTSFVLLRSALICLRGTRSTVRKSWDFRSTDIEIENTDGLFIGVFVKGHLVFFLLRILK